VVNLLKSLGVFPLSPKVQYAFDPSWESEILPRQLFMKMLCLERKRSERSGRCFLLMLLDPGNVLEGDGQQEIFENILSALRQSTRETDITGWFGSGATIGVIFTEIEAADRSLVTVLSSRVTSALATALSPQQLESIKLSFLIFPDDCLGQGPGNEAFSTFYPDLLHELQTKRSSLLAKRSLDIVGSLFAIALFSPLLVAIAVAIKVTSRGPLFFKQQRLGQYGKGFTFLKFRSMYVGADQTVHEKYVKQFISESAGSSDDGNNCGEVYKIKADSRVTRVGRFIRRTSLDELPQFFNCVMGQMALVGPRPPLPYEFTTYQTWHKRRLLVVKPGITGLWQVKGRSRVKFNDMVRMDLEYARTWSLWMDIKILLQTPLAMISGHGAY
jgi:lipopolysaccharide/colanic/teichoic acid biosynthesis glycosyltransferase